MNISVISVGKLKEKYLKAAINKYTKRLTRYCKLDLIEVQDESIPENASFKEEIQIKDKEGELILKQIKESIYLVALDLKGKMLSSKELAKFISDLDVNENGNIAFVIGGSLGLSEKVLNRANYKLCFSKMTFPHQLMRVILLEQIYRGFRIISGDSAKLKL